MHIAVGIVFLVAWMLCRKMPDGKKNMFGKPIKPCYQISCGLWSIINPVLKNNIYVNRLEEKMQILYPNKNKKEVVRQFLCYKCSLVFTICILALVISFIVVKKENAAADRVSSLEKEGFWGSEKEELLAFEVDGLEKSEKITVTVPQQKYEKKEISKILKRASKSLEKMILNKNKSLDYVTTDLNLISEIPDTEIKVTWDMAPDNYMEYNGVLIPEAVTRDAVVVNLTANLAYEDQQYAYCFSVCLRKEKKSAVQKLKSAILEKIKQQSVSFPAAEMLRLPESVDGKKVSYYYPSQAYGYKLFMALLIFSGLLFFIKDERLKAEIEARKKQMLVDYSEVVSKLTILLGAGMTIRMALEKMASDYDKKIKSGNGTKRYVYDEILFVSREIQAGVSERAGIDLLGKRCQIPCYMKLCSLLQQNLKKGSKGMAETLSYEVGQAFEERKNIAKKLGEEAGTKLLFPMVLMLVIVMVILILPACLSF